MEMNEQKKQIEDRMALIKNKVIILSNKGGVGKSTTTAILASYLNQKGYKVGLLDIDLHGPSQAKLFGLENKKILGDESGNLIPLEINSSFKIVTVAGLIDPEKAAIWRGPFKANLIMQFLSTIKWGELDYLLIDSPPGTGDEPLTAVQSIPELKALIVTTAQEMALIDTKKAISFLRELNVQILGLIQNMATAVCPHCEKEMDLFGIKSDKLNVGVSDMTNIPFIRSLFIAAEKGLIFEAVKNNKELNKYLEKISL